MFVRWRHRFVVIGLFLLAPLRFAIAVPPLPPSQLTAVSVGTQINLTWVDNSNNENGFRLERASIPTGKYIFLARLQADVTSYSDTDLLPANTYYYRVRAVRNKHSRSLFSNVAFALTEGPDDFPPSAPSGLIAAAAN